MRLTAWEEERLQIFTAAELARRRRARGLPLAHPEAVAIIADAMLEAAREGADYGAVEAAGRNALTVGEVMPGVASLLDEVRVEVLMGDGTRLVVLLDPLGGGEVAGPGAVVAGPSASPGEAPAGLERIELEVRSTSRRVIRVSSHYPFHRVNPRLTFERAVAAGYRLDIPAGDAVRWAPGETKRVRLVRYAGEGGS